MHPFVYMAGVTCALFTAANVGTAAGSTCSAHRAAPGPAFSTNCCGAVEGGFVGNAAYGPIRVVGLCALRRLRSRAVCRFALSSERVPASAVPLHSLYTVRGGSDTQTD